MDDDLLCDAQAGNPVRRSASINSYHVKVFEDNTKPTLHPDPAMSEPAPYVAIGQKGAETELDRADVLLRFSENVKRHDTGGVSLERQVLQNYAPALLPYEEPMVANGEITNGGYVCSDVNGCPQEVQYKEQALYLKFDQSVKPGKSGKIRVVDKNVMFNGNLEVVQEIDPRQAHYIANLDGSGMVEEKFCEQNFRVLNEMRILAKIRLVILDLVG